ncbi:MAG: outer-membrane lipoprotein carrier protein LolA [Erysipelotrichaceae bacterium]
MKTKIIAGIGIFVLVVALVFAVKPKSFEKTFEKTMNSMDTYLLEGDMEISKGEEVKSYVVQVGYAKKDNKEFYKVSLFDKALNQEQVILRNKQGVFVITPGLNQVFKFEGDWPMNSPKPYLLETMKDIVQSKKAEIIKEEKGYLVKSKVDYPNNKNFIKEEIMFNKDGKVEWLQIFNKDNNPELKIVFHKVEYNGKMDKNYFKAPSKLETKAGVSLISKEDLPLYPMQVFESRLSGKSEMQVNGEERHVLEYSGDKHFTVVETKKTPTASTQTVLMPGQIIDAMDFIGFYDGNQMSAIHDGVEFTIFSDDLSPDEMMSVITSMNVVVMK